jgi:hypothetical protein
MDIQFSLRILLLILLILNKKLYKSLVIINEKKIKMDVRDVTKPSRIPVRFFFHAT